MTAFEKNFVDFHNFFLINKDYNCIGLSFTYVSNLFLLVFFFLQDQTVTDEILIIETAVWQRMLHPRVDILVNTLCSHIFNQNFYFQCFSFFQFFQFLNLFCLILNFSLINFFLQLFHEIRNSNFIHSFRCCFKVRFDKIYCIWLDKVRNCNVFNSFRCSLLIFKLGIVDSRLEFRSSQKQLLHGILVSPCLAFPDNCLNTVYG